MIVSGMMVWRVDAAQRRTHGWVSPTDTLVALKGIACFRYVFTDGADKAWSAALK